MAGLRVLACAMVVAAGPAAAEGVMGTWWTQDHDGVIAIAPCAAGVCGRVAGITDFRPDGSPPVDVQGRSRCQLQIIPGGILGSDGVWASHITNPDDGKVYTTTMSLDANDRMRLRGYIGLPLFGRTVYWTRFTGHLTPDCHIRN